MTAERHQPILVRQGVSTEQYLLLQLSVAHELVPRPAFWARGVLPAERRCTCASRSASNTQVTSKSVSPLCIMTVEGGPRE